MKKLYKTIAVFLCMGIAVLGFNSEVLCQSSCGSCHVSMIDNPVKLPDSPPADLIRVLSTSCFDYGRILEEWYYVEELLVTTEKHIHDLEAKRYHVGPLFEQLTVSRDLMREVVKKPLTSLSGFQQDTGKLRFDIGKTYRDVKAKTIEQRDRNVFGILFISTLAILFLIVSGWRVASGTGVVNPARTKLGYDELKKLEEQGKEAV